MAIIKSTLQALHFQRVAVRCKDIEAMVLTQFEARAPDDQKDPAVNEL
jgi:hypothetical protein